MRTAVLSSFFFLAAFGLNLSTLSPAVHPDDSPETVTAGLTLSIQHPPGYPLHSLMGRLASLSLPGGGAFGVNLLSAVMGALGLLLFAFAARMALAEYLGRDPGLLVALAPATALAATYSLWFQSSIAKGGIYTLNFALTQAALLGLLWARQSPDSRPGLRLAALFFGLGMANHWTSQVVLLPGFALLLAEPWWREGRPRPAAAAKEGLSLGLIVLAGFSLYLFLPLRSLLHPVMSWGEPWKLKGFFWVFNRAQYAGIESGKSLAAFLALLMRMLEDLRYEFHWLGLALVAGGWVLLFMKKPWFSAALLSMPLTLALAVALKANPPADSLWVIDPYLLPLYAGLALGLCGLFTLEFKWTPVLLVAGALGLGIWHWPMANQSRNFLGYDYAANLYLSAPKNALLFCEGDSNTALPFYYRHVLGKRKDVAAVATVLSDYRWYIENVARQNPGLKIPQSPMGPASNIAWMSRENAPRPVLLTNSMTKAWVEPQRVLPRGLLSRYLDKGPSSTAQLRANRVWPAYSLRGVFNPALPMDPLSVRLVRDNYKEAPARLAYALNEANDYAGAENEFAFLGRLMPGWAAPWLQAGNCAYFGRQLERAGQHWRRASEEDPKSAEALVNLGLYFFDKKDYDQSMKMARKALEINPGLPNAIELQQKSIAMINRGQAPVPAANSATEWASKGDQFAQRGQAAEAIAAYDQAIRLGFATPGVYRNRAVMFSKLNKAPEAVAEMKKAVAGMPADAELRKYLGIMLFNGGDAKNALLELKESQRLNPKDPNIVNLINQVSAKAAP